MKQTVEGVVLILNFFKVIVQHRKQLKNKK